MHRPFPSRLALVGVFFGVLAFLLLTAPENHTEAEDAFSYAWTVEHGGADLFHPHHLLYAPLARVVYLAGSALWPGLRAFAVLRALSLASALLVVLLLPRLVRQLGAGRAPEPTRGTGAAAALLLFSYGFWRYATEAEIYLPAMAFIVLAMLLALAPGGGRCPGAAVCGVLAILLHVLAAIPVLFVIPWLLWNREPEPIPVRIRRVGAWCCAVSGPVILAYGVAVAFRLLSSLFDGRAHPEGGANLNSVVKGLLAFGQNVLSGNFLFAFPAFRDLVARVFPSRMLAEEFLMGEALGVRWAMVSTVTMGLGLALLAVVFWKLLARIRWQARRAWFGPVAGWLAVQAAVCLLFEPGNPEMWLLILLPLWLWVGLAMPLLPRRLAVGLAAALAIHNAVGGLLWVRHERGDYNRAKADVVMDRLEPGDGVITADAVTFWRYVRYHAPAEAFHVPSHAADEMAAALTALLERTTGRVWVFDDVFHPPDSLSVRFPGTAQSAVGAAAEWLRPRIRGPVVGVGRWRVFEVSDVEQP